MSDLVIERVRGREIERYLDDLARLRITVFREYPYLYEGSLAYEQRYLASYSSSPAGCVVVARVEHRVVGASTATPLTAHNEEVAPALVRAGYPAERVYYFGESVLLPSYRGRGIGHAFFDHRESAAREHGFSVCAFCAVDRGPSDPRKPADYVPHDAFWQKRGYIHRPDIVAHFSWRDVGAARETQKPMTFWIKELVS